MARLDTLIGVGDVVCVDLNDTDELIDVEVISLPQASTGNCWALYQESSNMMFYIDTFVYIYRNASRPKLVRVPVGPDAPGRNKN